MEEKKEGMWGKTRGDEKTEGGRQLEERRVTSQGTDWASGLSLFSSCRRLGSHQPMNRKLRWRLSIGFPESEEMGATHPISSQLAHLGFPQLPTTHNKARSECQSICPWKLGGAHSAWAMYNKMQHKFLNHPSSQQSRSAKTRNRSYLNCSPHVRSCAHASKAFEQNLSENYFTHIDSFVVKTGGGKSNV